MKKPVAAFAVSVFLSFSASGSDYQVMFETTSCTGETGFATARVEDVYKVENAACTADGKKLKKILIKNGAGSYDVFTLTETEARSVIADMKAYMRARLKNLENANTLIITK